MRLGASCRLLAQVKILSRVSSVTNSERRIVGCERLIIVRALIVGAAAQLHEVVIMEGVIEVFEEVVDGDDGLIG